MSVCRRDEHGRLIPQHSPLANPHREFNEAFGKWFTDKYGKPVLVTREPLHLFETHMTDSPLRRIEIKATVPDRIHTHTQLLSWCKRVISDVMPVVDQGYVGRQVPYVYKESNGGTDILMLYMEVYVVNRKFYEA